MSYTATGTLSIRLKDNIDKEQFMVSVNQYNQKHGLPEYSAKKGRCFDIHQSKFDENQVLIRLLYDTQFEFADIFRTKTETWVVGEYHKKYEECDIYSLLHMLIPYMESCEFPLRGEDGELWRFILKEEEIKEEQGEIVYSAL